MNPENSFLKNQNLCIVDLETTGGNCVSNRIIEIAILVIEQGKLVSTYSSLVNPEAPIPYFIQNLTSIQPSDLEEAPVFAEIKDDIYQLLKDRLFIAHNVRFDYGFIKNEFKRHQISFSEKSLCTVRLSRKLFPQEKRHNLDSLIERFDLKCADRHRALGDALAVWEFLQLLPNHVTEEAIEKAWKIIGKTPTHPPNLLSSTIESLPHQPGVYIFKDANQAPLYVGKSIDIKTRVLSHFSSDHRNQKEMKLCQQTVDIEAIKSSGELGALLLESHLVKKLQPLYNRALRRSRRLVVLKKSKNKEGYETVQMEHLDSIHPEEISEVLGLFRSNAEAKKFLNEKVDEFGLCPQLLGLEKGKGSCFSHQIKKCRGACIGLDSPLQFNLRFLQAFHERKIKAWPFEGPILIEEKQEEHEEGNAFLVDQWCLIGKIEYNTQSYDFRREEFIFDPDSYKILLKYLLNSKKRVRIKKITKSALKNITSDSQNNFYS